MRRAMEAYSKTAGPDCVPSAVSSESAISYLRLGTVAFRRRRKAGPRAGAAHSR